MPDFESMEHDELLNCAQIEWLRAQDAIGKLKWTEGKLDEALAEQRALDSALRMAQGQAKNAFHNCEAAKIKAERTIEEYRKRMEVPVDKLVKDERDRYKKLYKERCDEVMRLCDVLRYIQEIARKRELPGEES
jgi:hypothetical protein